MVGKKRLPGANERVKVGRRLITPPAVTSMIPSTAAAPATAPGDSELERPTDEPTEELTRMIKAAYQ
jgi:hypothetical protein